MGMTERLVVDTNVVVALLRGDRPVSEVLRTGSDVLLPLPVIGELFAGSHYSHRVAENLAKVEEIVATWPVLHPDLSTARVYGQLRGRTGSAPVTPSRLNDLWIAALCLQHSVPLLTNDRGFDVIPGLTLIHW